MPAYQELNDLVEQVNVEVAELDEAKAAEVQAEDVLTAAQVVVQQEKVQVEAHLDNLLIAVQTRLAEIKGEEPPVDPVP